MILLTMQVEELKEKNKTLMLTIDALQKEVNWSRAITKQREIKAEIKGHGLSMYNSGCRCDSCRAAARMYQLAYREQKKARSE